MTRLRTNGQKAPKNRGDTTFIPYISSRNMERKPGGEGGGQNFLYYYNTITTTTTACTILLLKNSRRPFPNFQTTFSQLPPLLPPQPNQEGRKEKARGSRGGQMAL